MRHFGAVLFALGGAALEIATPASGVESSWAPARETHLAGDGANDAQVALGFSPRPTEPAALFGRMLLPRQEFTMGPATCGFVATESNSFTCITNGATCTPQGGYVGCCTPNSACSAIKTTCINFSSSSAGACNLPSDYHTLCCATSTLAECYTWVISTTAKTDTSIEPYTLFACSATGGRGTLLTRDPAWPDPTTPSSSARATSSAPAETTSAAASPPSGSQKSSTNLGAIIGGAVGGAAGLGLIGLATFLIMRRKKSDAAAARPDSTIPQPMSPSSPEAAYANAGQPGYQYGPLPPQPGAPQPNYDPNMAYGGQAYQQYPPQQQYGGYTPQQAYAAHLAAPSSSVSPPPVSPNSPQPSELNASSTPLGAEGNRAELPST